MSSLEQFFSKLLGGTSTERELKRIRPLIDVINGHAEAYQKLSNEELSAKTHEFKYRLKKGETLDDLMPEAFAVVKETCRRLIGQKWLIRGHESEWDMVPYDVQLLGAIVLHEGKIAEMATGEGKTLVASMPLYLNALEGKGVHLITVNDYLAQRDCEWMGPIYQFLGLSVAAIFSGQTPEERKQAYSADISYGTNNEFGFDYLRDNMATDIWSVVQRKLNYAIVDEVDSVLIDEARTPLIISGAVGAPRNVYYELKPIVARLYQKQKELVSSFIRQGRDLLDKDEEQAGMFLLRAQRGNPKDQELLDLLTSEFWIKRLIERILGHHEVNKTTYMIDSELYYTIDEKSHVLDITEKGRIFLSGGRDQDVAEKIQILDQFDELLEKLSDSKRASNYFTQDSMTGMCNGFTLEGKIVLCKCSNSALEEHIEAVEQLSEKVKQIAQKIAQQGGDKSAQWRSYYAVSKKVDRTVNGLGVRGVEFLGNNKAADALQQLFSIIKNIADVDGEFQDSRVYVERRKEMYNLLFEVDKQTGCPEALTPEGKLAVLGIMLNGDPLMLPVINQVEKMLDISSQSGSSADASMEAVQEYFEFSNNNTVIKHVTEKGRIILLGGNPELYVLPDRSAIEERDQRIQQLLDQTLNQTDYDYAAKVVVVEQLERVIRDLARVGSNQKFYTIQSNDAEGEKRVIVTDTGKYFLSDFSEQIFEIVNRLDVDIRDRIQNLDKVFALNPQGQLVGLADEQLDRLLGLSYNGVKNAIDEWKQHRHGSQENNPVVLRLELDRYLESKGFSGEMPSVSRCFEQVTTIRFVFERTFSRLNMADVTRAEKFRLLRRHFELMEVDVNEKNPFEFYGIAGLNDKGKLNLPGIFNEKAQVAEILFAKMNDPEMDPDAIFERDNDGFPLKLQKAARSLLVDGLPFFNYEQNIQKFRDEILHISSKKANSRAELEGYLQREKAQLRGKNILLEDREMNELLVKAHTPNVILSSEEIENWFRLNFQRQPLKALENQRDRMWNEYTQVEERIQNISQLLRAYTLYQRDVDYVVKAVEESESRRTGTARGHKAVMIVDQFTGRLMPGRRFSDGLHEALEAKEGVEVQAESQTLATITIQNFFRLYKKLAGMTGTAETEAQEFFSTYKMDVVVIPTNKPVVRDDYNDVIYRTKKEKYAAIIDEALDMHQHGRPVLIGTVSVDVSQQLSQLLTLRGVPIANWLKKGDVTKELESGRFHTVLNAKFHKNEAEIVAKAGLPGTITIATNMAGRGTDIKLTPDTKNSGGLHIIGSEKHEARRIDRQLRGRSGRQGDPGSSRFYLSLEDDLMRLFGSDRITSIMSRMGSMEEGERIEHSLITRSIERAQKKVEERNFDIRKNLLEYDDVLNDQRKIIYKRRQNLLGFAQPDDYIESKRKRYLGEERDAWQLENILKDLKSLFGSEPEVQIADLEVQKEDEIIELLLEWIENELEVEKHLQQMQERHRILGYNQMESIIPILIELKIGLHSAGTKDVEKWNLEGIGMEMERIFAAMPEWLLKNSVQNAEELKQRLVTWALEIYKSTLEQNQKTYDWILFLAVPTVELKKVFVFGMMNQHLSPAVPSISWNVDEFLAGMERIFLARPPLGVNEIRTIRREKIQEKVYAWLDELVEEENEEQQIRHRILGYFSSIRLIDTLVHHSFLLGREDGAESVDDFTDAQKEYLVSIFGQEYLKMPEGESSDKFIVRAIHNARRIYLEFIYNSIDAYDQILLFNATSEEMIQSAIIALLRELDNSPRNFDEKKSELSQRCEFMFLSRPSLNIPAQIDNASLVAMQETLVNWGLNLYQVYSDRIDRLRQERLSGEIVRDSVFAMIDETLYNLINNILGQDEALDPSQMVRLEAECRLVFRQSPRIRDENDEVRDPREVLDRLNAWAKDLYQKRVREIGENQATRFERYHILNKIDENWRHHLNAIDELREGIGLRGYGQKDPLLEYKSEAYKMFVSMVENLNRDIVATLFKFFDIGGEIEERELRRQEPKDFSESHSQVEIFKQVMAKESQRPSQRPADTPQKRKPIVKGQQVGRNQPCPCGSGKKYKNCCGRNV
ncbi:SEC-C domain-containing protein [candidate division KSB1 bacterium]|nr:SEC-C domain-containing protein [candidate division KSB1 bacterium]